MADVVDPQQMGHDKVDVLLATLPAEVVFEVIVYNLVAGVEVVDVEGVGADCRVAELVELDPGIVPEHCRGFVEGVELGDYVVGIHLRGQECLEDVARREYLRPRHQGLYPLSGHRGVAHPRFGQKGAPGEPVPEVFDQLEPRNVVEPQRIHDQEDHLAGPGRGGRQQSLGGVAGEVRVDLKLHLEEEEEGHHEEQEEELHPLKHCYLYPSRPELLNAVPSLILIAKGN